MATEERLTGLRNLPTVTRLVERGWHARLFGIALGLGLWTLVASFFPAELMPYPYETLVLAWGLIESGVAWTHVGYTFWLTIWGFVGSIILGGILGVLMGVNDYGRRFFTPYVFVGLSIPAIAWAAVTTLIFGFSQMAPIIATVLTTFPYIAINVWKGVEQLDADLLNMCKSFELSKKRLLTRLVLPTIAPSLFTATRFGLAISWKIVTIAEIFAGNQGVGYKLMQAYQLYKFEEAWAWAILFMLIIILIEYGIFKPLERKVFDYRRDADFDLLG